MFVRRPIHTALSVLTAGILVALTVTWSQPRVAAAGSFQPRPSTGKVGICHRTSSATNPFVYKQVSPNAVAAHQEHGDIIGVTSQADCDEQDGPEPSCQITFDDPGPPARIEVTFQDTDAGLAELVVTQSENADTIVPPFIPGTTDPVVISSTKIDQTKVANIEVRAVDLEGNVALCDFSF